MAMYVRYAEATEEDMRQQRHLQDQYSEASVLSRVYQTLSDMEVILS